MPVETTLVTVQETNTVFSDYAESFGNVVQILSQQGPSGPAGQDLATVTTIVTGTVTAFSAVTVTGVLGNFPLLGVSTMAGASGEAVEVQQAGFLVNTAWSWQLGLPIYALSNGNLTQDIPLVGNLVIVGFAASATKIFIKQEPAILLA